MNRRWMIKIVLTAIVLSVAAAASYAQLGVAGLWSSGAGAAFAATVLMITWGFHHAARRKEGPAVIRAVMLGLIVAFGAVATSVVVVVLFWPRFASSFALTLLALYLVHRMYDAWSDFSKTTRLVETTTSGWLAHPQEGGR